MSSVYLTKIKNIFPAKCPINSLPAPCARGLIFAKIKT
nr:MAG TPA: hypothetical protein [Caudoviricetes sp.]